MKFLCKECWLAHEPTTLLALCNECDTRTQVRRLDPLKSKMAGSVGDGGELVCRLHPEEPLEIFCGECRAQVPPRAVMSPQSVVALVGDTASGKTSLLWVLTERLRQAGGRGVMIRQSFGDSDVQLNRAMREIVEYGGPRPTMRGDADLRNYAWELMTSDGARDGWVIAFHDAAGEVWRDLAASAREHERLHRYLGLVGAIVLTIDGERIAEALDTRSSGRVASPELLAAEAHEITIIDQLARKIRARGYPVPVGVTVTKADILWDRVEWELFRRDSGAKPEEIDAAVRDLLARCGRQALLAALAKSFAPLSFFAVSAFGHAPGVPLELAALQPSRVEEPLLAVLGASRVTA
jgi:energy-coupling factor transporter ATP-binding protein EcfA2